ncbi:DUF1579 domain-containing protein [Pseudoalteromonas denitrificans]|uniref:DUF1579 domain-containing protein n=1 Tax=Pseudoalteromonas denitrificans DSM 6059 TaxID=1123010 RepID=A0A1I1NA27_9GAMM|nr:DUF1579 domain-containing protein [Pseudoalteromonas denitrificans]SFC91613.1 hypothetical protein SAMN02745724_02901 [Pseudoalteromonas denitrificans DSM 6059]
MNTKNLHSGSDDFNFFIGQWQVKHKKRIHRLIDSQEWEEFEGTCISQKILGGYGNFDDNLLNLPEETYCAVTLRTYNKKTNMWSIWWVDGRFVDQLDEPMKGQFSDGVGIFYADDMFQGKTIKVRFIWTLPTPETPRWEQAFSTDSGRTWETNWIMDFSK